MQLSSYSDTIASIESSEALDKNSPRYQVWKSSVEMIRENSIIGTGLGSFSQNVGNEGYNSS